MQKRIFNIRYKALQIVAAILFAAAIFVPRPQVKAGPIRLFTSDSTLTAATDTAAMILRDSLLNIKIDSLVAIGQDSLAQIFRDSLFFGVDSSANEVVLTERQIRKAQKRKVRDSIFNYKDSLIRATPRFLNTYIFNDSIKNQRMFLWKTDGYFNKQELLSPDTTFNDNFHELPYQKNDVGATYLGVADSAMQY
ncbi:MAG: hypothetical protein IKD16_01805, partial [Bacteroidales bacterium]|nr:hypothetical protein [Bacteroidales bacterium]